ncbi:hypothetical protein HNO89_000459 [Sporosarcina luteola]|nr:hypothetical protein [Sporosarcina luteola]
MKRINRFILALIAMVLMFLPWQEVGVAKEWAFQSIDQVDKAWSIKFNLQLDGDSLTSTSIYITDGTNIHPSTSRLTGNGKEVQVVPSNPYEVGKAYWVMITNQVKSSDGKPLKTPIEVPFQVVDPNAKIQAVHSTTSGMFTTFIVTVHPDVHKVTIGTQELTFIGNNQYTGTFIDLKQNSTVTINGYDENNKRLQSVSYKVQ